MRASDLNPETQRKLFGEVIKPPPRTISKTAEDTFAFQCMAMKLPPFEREFKFATEQGLGFRFDFAWPRYKAALECDCLVIKRVRGDLIVSGRHVHPNGWRRDAEKYALAACLGWHVLRFEQTQITNGIAIDFMVRLLQSKGWAAT